MKNALMSESRFRVQNPPRAAIFFSVCAKLYPPQYQSYFPATRFLPESVAKSCALIVRRWTVQSARAGCSGGGFLFFAGDANEAGGTRRDTTTHRLGQRRPGCVGAIGAASRERIAPAGPFLPEPGAPQSHAATDGAGQRSLPETDQLESRRLEESRPFHRRCGAIDAQCAG